MNFWKPKVENDCSKALFCHGYVSYVGFFLYEIWSLIGFYICQLTKERKFGVCCYLERLLSVPNISS